MTDQDAQSAESADVRAVLANDHAERDVFLRQVVAELFQENTRWPGLWTRLDSLLAERDRLDAELVRARHQRDMAVIERDRAYAALGRLLTDKVTVNAVLEIVEATYADRVGS